MIDFTNALRVVAKRLTQRTRNPILLSSLIAIGALLAGCGDEPANTTVNEAAAVPMADPATRNDIQQAKTAIGTFATALKSELTEAMQAGGPLNAIEVCNTEAIAIRDRVSSESGMTLSRVSLKNRNPDNAPNDWQRPVLESFDELQRTGSDPTQLDWHETVQVDGQTEFRYMKAIPTGGLCLQCHGQTIAPEVAQTLDELYPDDKATGFSVGEIRGAFVVTN